MTDTFGHAAAIGNHTGVAERIIELLAAGQAASPLLFIAIYALATMALLPGSLFTMAAGVLYGLGMGTLYAWTGATVGATGSFLIARLLGRRPFERAINKRPRFAAVDRAIAGEGLRVAVLLRLSPVLPFNLLNYALGLTGLSLRHNSLACLAMLPGALMYVYYGKLGGSVLAAAAGGAEHQQGAGYWTWIGLGLAATVAAVALLTRAARRELASIEESA
jgi:uncharacterized membrane protein YdjX (TVP38/TMEM64 family)